MNRALAQVTKPRSEKTLEFFLEVIMENLFDIYAKGYPQDPREALRERLRNTLLRPLAVIHTAGNAPFAKGFSGDAILARAFENNQGVDSELPFVVACTYWVEAYSALPRDRETAWSYAIEAMFYCGTVKASDSFDRALPILSEKIRAEARRVASANAGNARKEILAEIGKEAVRLVRLQGEGGERWINYREAATSVAAKVQEYAKRKGQPFYAADGGVRTIATYLKKALELTPYIKPGNHRRRSSPKNL